MQKKTPKPKCPVCKSEEIEIGTNTIKCNKCGYFNDNYRTPKSYVKHPALHKKNLKKFDKETLNNFYNETLSIWVNTINKNRENFPSPVKPALDKLSEEFEENLKGFFEMIEMKLELIKENEEEENL